MSTIISSRTVITRKPHQCHGCGSRFEAKTIMTYVANNNDGDFFDAYWCLPCYAFYKTLTYEDIGDGLYVGDLRNYSKYKSFSEEHKLYLNEIINYCGTEVAT